MVLDDIMNFALRGKFVDSETKLLSAPSAHAGSNLPRKVCRRGKEGVGGREKIDPEKQGKRKKISSNQSRMNLSSIIARDASLYPLKSYKCKPVAWQTVSSAAHKLVKTRNRD